MAEKSHRLTANAYLGQTTVAFTACLQDRTKSLATPPVAGSLLTALKNSCERHSVTVPIYCVMPDHMHLVLRGASATSNVKLAMNRFKAASGWWFYRNRPELMWQKDYWDHVIWPDEDWSEQIRYIAENPCRAGLAKDISDWPYTGSIGHGLKEILVEAMF